MGDLVGSNGFEQEKGRIETRREGGGWEPLLGASISFVGVIPRRQGFDERMRPTEGSGDLGNPNLALCLRLRL